MAVTNPELAAALATVPEIARAEKTANEAEKRLREHRAGAEPHTARDRVIDEAVSALTSTGKWTADIGKKAAAAYQSAMEWESERTALRRAKDAARDYAIGVREALAGDALAYLGRRLDETLSAAREAGDVLGDVRTADEAIRAGGAVVEAWSRLQGLVVDLKNVREAQWDLLSPPLRTGQLSSLTNRPTMLAWRNAGHGEIRGFRVDDAPEILLDAARSRRYSVDYVLWLSRRGTAYVPGSVEELTDEVEAAKPEPIFYDDNGPVTLRVIETPIPAPKASEVYAHSRAPHLNYSDPAPVNPNPNATPDDPTAPVWRY
ncbi:hypothetical protein OG259_16475 [Streptomyces sp. NBC_00250]|uniref:hypothetical protein n=1 Tax=Streptomyces sp. NBC_00250 TaxID=2903641 RepID=UPI002E28D60A|nr:hypothetical protein [Streptomyces sp. NBC_00250]